MLGQVPEQFCEQVIVFKVYRAHFKMGAFLGFSNINAKCAVFLEHSGMIRKKKKMSDDLIQLRNRPKHD